MKSQNSIVSIFVSCANFILVVTAVVGLYFTYSSLNKLNDQMIQNEEHLKWQNYNHLNERYSNLMLKISKITDSKTSFENIDSYDKWVVRQYFDLTSEEYWLHKNNLIPNEMWNSRIINGVKLNIKNQILYDGFQYWETQGAFKHPNDFSKIIKKLAINKSNE